MWQIKNKVRVHFIGIGGIGMSGLAHLLIRQGVQVSGSDLNASAVTAELKKLGATIFIGHHGDHVNGATVAVYTSAATAENPEIIQAKKINLPLIPRAEMLSELMRLKCGVAIAGTHGKTTTSALVTTILQECGLDPTYVIGGRVSHLQGHAEVGRGEFLVAEADESDGSFLMLNPVYAVITNIDNDHLDFYQTEENLFKAFIQFANKVPFYGTCALNLDDPYITRLIPLMKRPVITYGIHSAAQLVAKNITTDALRGTHFELFHNGEFCANVQTKLFGEHNVLNALAAISIARQLGPSFKILSSAIEKFEGVSRRFQVLQTINHRQVVDDYAHHPTEIMATLQSAYKVLKDFIVIFEPHRYSRLKSCFNQFIDCFAGVEEMYLLPLYPASEEPIPGMNSETLCKAINEKHGAVCQVLSYEQLTKFLNQWKMGQSKHLLFMGAGLISKNVREYFGITA